MSDYRSVYERYYKNINNLSKEKKKKTQYLSFSNQKDNIYKGNYMDKGRGENYFIKILIRQLIASTLLILILFGLKVIPLKEVNGAYTFSKNMLSKNFDYDQSIDVFNSLKIGNLNADNLKYENLKKKTSKFIDYLKENSNLKIKARE